MQHYSLWMFGLALAYTILLVTLGHIMKRRAKKGEDYFVGGRCFGRWTVAFCITGLFSGSTFIAILELAYFKGLSAMWYGVAEMSHVLVIALVLIGPFRRKMMVTISGLIGDKYGRAAKAIAGAITAFTFPMWSVATALAFASCINAITGIDLMTAVIITAALLYVFLQAGGMWSVAMTQTANFFAYMAMFAVGIEVCHAMNKMRLSYDSFAVHVEADRREEIPQVFTVIRVHYIVTGEGLSLEKFRKAFELGAVKYCSVANMVKKACEVVYAFSVNGERHEYGRPEA